MTISSKEAATAAADVITSLTVNVDALKKALQIAKMQPNPGFVFCWPEYWLGVRFVQGGKVCGCRVDQAFVTHRADKRVFTNGKDEEATLMPLVEALEGALAHGIKVHADFAEALSKPA